jgi:hypothetical protein
MTPFIFVAVAVALADTGTCRPAPGYDAAALLRVATERVGAPHTGDSVAMFHVFDQRQHAYESDRMYPPWLVDVASVNAWFDPATGVERATSHLTIAGFELDAATLGDGHVSYSVRDSTLTPSEEVHGALYDTRPLNVLAVLADWNAARDVRVEGSCAYRDYPRVVLSRRGARGVERLFIDAKSGYPTKLDRVEPHYLWGQIHVEFVYSTWQRVGNMHLPGVAFRMDDGVTAVTRTFGVRRLVPRDSAPSLVLPAHSGEMAMKLPTFLQPTKPDTIRVSATTYLLRNRGYTEAVSLVRDTAFVFDATQGEERVHQDSLWIGTLFPGRHPIVVVVTDLAWPHVSGVRAWVARGATIVTHRAARDFLTQVVNRRWTLQPDLLERQRSRTTFHVRTVDTSLELAGGEVQIYPIDGVGSEVALMAFMRPDRFLWGSDFIQDLGQPTQYVEEVVAAVRRVGIEPIKVAAEHAPLSDWSRVLPLGEPDSAR